MKTILFLILSILSVTVLTKTAKDWRTRTIYQIVTDRFARSDDQTPECKDLFNYCGGTFKGIEKNLDYIQGMGIDAIWISPVVENAPKGYHGYWQTNIYEINSHFGSEQDLKDLLKACYERDIWVMVDVVPNHVAPVPNNIDFSNIYPFNHPKYYHWPITSCKEIDENYPTNQTGLEYCWLLGLPDLNTENEFVSNTLLSWIKDFTHTYEVDGLRLDALRHVPKWFWKKFSEAAGVFTIGEAWNHDVEYCAGYQGVVDSLLNFPLHGTLDYVFLRGDSMVDITKHYEKDAMEYSDISVLGNFVVNHDLPRFLHNGKSDLATFKAYYSFVLTSVGIPIVYYGDEQLLDGGTDPDNRRPLWGKMDPNSEMYQYFKKIITLKKQTQFAKYEQIERLADDTFYAFSRGKYFFAFTNSKEDQIRTIKSHPYEDNTVLCDLFDEKDCVEVQNKKFELLLSNKQPKILIPKETNSS